MWVCVWVCVWEGEGEREEGGGRGKGVWMCERGAKRRREVNIHKAKSYVNKNFIIQV